ncbi:MAG: HEAT repeat domain-containing protein [Phycisphaerales bacterium]|nr:HEAT repeat domain-containing protein [Phycisphaerales bacterium]
MFLGIAQPSRPLAAACIALFCVGVQARAPADRLLLGGGGVIEGRLVSEDRNTLRIAGFMGELDVPALIVVRHIAATSLLEQYESLAGTAPLDAGRHAALAAWCLEQKLPSLARQHLDEALRMDPSHPQARRLFGYVRIGDAWLKTADPPSAPPKSAEGDARVIEQLRAAWRRRIHGLRDVFLREGAERGVRTFDEGREQLLAIRAPLAMEGVCALLGDEGERTRVLLMEHLATFKEDEALLNLLAFSLLDGDLDVRVAAADALAARNDPRVGEFLRQALRARVDEIVRRAAVALGRLKSLDAFDDLVRALPTDAFATERRSLGDLMREAERTFSAPIEVPIDDRVARAPARMALPDWVRRVEQIEASASPPTARNRSEVQEALIALTGQNYGFDADAWRDWMRQQSVQNSPP